MASQADREGLKIPRPILLKICRKFLSLEGNFRFWELGKTRYRPQWFHSGWPDLFLDAEFYFREAKQSAPTPALRLNTPAQLNGVDGDLSVTFDRVSLYRATYQLRLAELDGDLLAVVG